MTQELPGVKILKINVVELIGIGPGRRINCDRDLSPVSLKEEVLTSSCNPLGRLALQQ